MILLTSLTISARDRVSPLEVTLDLLGLTEAEMLLLRSPSVDCAKWCNSETHDCFRLLRQDKQLALYREGDFQVYVEDLVSLQNFSMSRNRGATYGAYPVLMDSTLLLFGGYGFWRNIRTVVHFSKVTLGWEATEIHNLPQSFRELHEGAFRVGEHIYWSPWLGGETYTEETNQVWLNTIPGGPRELYGHLPLKFSTIKPLDYYETKNFVLLTDFVNRAFIIRKSDLQIAEFQNKNLVMQLIATSGSEYIQMFRGDVIELWKDGERAIAYDLLDLSRTIDDNNWAPFVEKATPQDQINTWQAIFKQLLNELQLSNGVELKLASNESKPEDNSLFYFLIGALAFGGGMIGWGAYNLIRSTPYRSKKSKSARTPHQDHHHDPNGSEQISVSPELAQLLSIQSKTLTTAEFDELMGLDPDGVAETTRARRSRIIKDVQAESSKLLGSEILIRMRSREDARKVQYKIRDFSSASAWHSLREFLQVEEEADATK